MHFSSPAAVRRRLDVEKEDEIDLIAGRIVQGETEFLVTPNLVDCGSRTTDLILRKGAEGGLSRRMLQGARLARSVLDRPSRRAFGAPQDEGSGATFSYLNRL
jgi:hypothetical protein